MGEISPAYLAWRNSMSDCFSVYTVITKIPFDLINSSDLVILKAFGVNWENCDKYHTRYFFSEGSLDEEIEVMGSYGCSKVTPGAFGGWAIRITKNRALSVGTEDILREMRKGVDTAVYQSESLNQYQNVLKDMYAEGMYSHIRGVVEDEIIDDTLFLFLMRELSTSEGCDSLDEAIRRLNTAKTDLGSCIEALLDDAESAEMT